MDTLNLPSLSRSPSGSEDSRIKSLHNNSSEWLAIQTDLTETVNALSESCSPVTPSFYTGSWSTDQFYGTPLANAPTLGLSDLSQGFQKQDGEQTRSLPAIPNNNEPSSDSASSYTAKMSTEQLQQYLAASDPFALGTSMTSTGQSGQAAPSLGLDPLSLTTAVSTQDSFQQQVLQASIQADTLPVRSPSPLLELDFDMLETDDSASQESSGVTMLHRRASDVGGTPRTRANNPRRHSANLPVEEKLRRAQATEGLSKQDRRRVQNKLAQRAFRARSKVANRNVYGRLDHLEELTEQQADRIEKMTELVTRLQRENTGLRAAHFQATMKSVLQERPGA